MKYNYTFKSKCGIWSPGQETTTVTASTEREARRLAMVARWGSKADKVTPDGPEYQGKGLELVSKVPRQGDE